MKYNDLYTKNDNVWGKEPNILLQKITSELKKTGKFLDLSCGQGRDCLFMLQKSWDVVGVDSSEVAINSIKQNLKKTSSNLELYVEDVANYQIKENYFDLINCYNTFQFLLKKDAISLIEKIKKGLLSGGYILISGFTKNDSAYKEEKGFFNINEIKKVFDDFAIILTVEEEILDKGHPGYPDPHKHHVYRLIAKKV